MKNGNITVTPHIGYYLIETLDRWGAQVYMVGKDKRCTCGGTAKRPCRHIRAVTGYLKAGGERAPKERPNIRPPKKVPPSTAPATCPVCNTPVESEKRGRWRCPNSPSHYFRWRGEQGVRQFLTQPHPNKTGAYYDQTIEQRTTFLTQAARRTVIGGYSPQS